MSTCPDSDLYSAYVDGEVPSPWKEKLASHIASCDACKKRTQRYQNLRSQIIQGVRALSEEDLETSFSRLNERRLSPSLLLKKKKDTYYLAWTRSLVRIPIPALAAMLLAAFFLPAYFTLKQTSANISQNVKSLSTSVPVYSPDLLPYAKTESLLAANRQQLFTVLSFASQFESTKDFFSNAEIIIIKLPDLTQFSNTGEQLFAADDPLPQAAGFYR